ncbi:MAG: prephenate dehydrogenase [Oscillospiraceae bacterium]|nr:prephenate dehydrogenase [Oscillospiraceae bacterium]
MRDTPMCQSVNASSTDPPTLKRPNAQAPKHHAPHITAAIKKGSDAIMNVGIIGLGLIGGSFAKAYKASGHTVYAKEIDESIYEFARLSGAVDALLDDDTITKCELILIAIYPRAAIEFIQSNASRFSPQTTVIDCCGTKQSICACGFEAAARYGFTYVGGHPMAGIEQSGFKYSKANLFKGASMIIVPPKYDDILFFEKIKELLAPACFGNMTITTAKRHDEMIAYTSQLAHLVSNAYIKSPTVREHKGFSAGSYKDLTRVAWLNESMWAELFMENKTNLLSELDLLMASLAEYREALQNEEYDRLRLLLLDGKRLKEEVDRR